MFLAVAIKDFKKEIQGALGQGKWEAVYGVQKVVSGKEWALLKKDNSIGKAYNYPIKQGVKPQTITIDDKSVKLQQLSENQYALVSIDPQPFGITTPAELQSLLATGSESPRVSLSYLFSSFPDCPSLITSKLLTLIPGELTIKDDPAASVVKQYFNKQFRADQAYMIPQYMKETGNWSDKETVKLTIS